MQVHILAHHNGHGARGRGVALDAGHMAWRPGVLLPQRTEGRPRGRVMVKSVILERLPEPRSVQLLTPAGVRRCGEALTYRYRVLKYPFYTPNTTIGKIEFSLKW